MPEDQVIEEEGSEQIPDPEGEAGFDEFADGEYEEAAPGVKPEEEEDEPSSKEPKEEKPKADEEKPKPSDEEQEPGKDDKGEDKSEEEDEDDKTPAQKAIDARLAELGKPDDDDEDGEKPKEDKPKEPEKPKEEPPAPGKLTKEQIQFHMSVINDDELPDGEMIIGDQSINFSELKEDDPDAYNMAKVMASYTTSKYLNSLVKEGRLVTGDTYKKTVEGFNQVISDMSYDMALVVNGYREGLALSKTDEFKTWIEAQPDGVKKLAGTPDPKDGMRVLDLYNESIGDEKTAEHDQKLKDKKQRKDGLLKGTSNIKPSGPAPKKDKKDDDEAAFDEFAE